MPCLISFVSFVILVNISPVDMSSKYPNCFYLIIYFDIDNNIKMGFTIIKIIKIKKLNNFNNNNNNNNFNNNK